MVLQATQFGVLYSFSIFFKPLIAQFGWSRAALSGAYSVLMLFGGFLAVPVGWLADKFGPRKIASLCGALVGLGLILSSQITELWQFYITYGVLVGAGVSGIAAIASGITARWFDKKRGLAMGIVSAGVGLGTLVSGPVSERLIDAFGWSAAYLIIGAFTLVFMIGSALLLRRDPKEMDLLAYGAGPNVSFASDTAQTGKKPLEAGVGLREALDMAPLWLIVFVFFLMSGASQMIIVHLANYATDIGITPFIAATVISAVGLGSVVGRLIMGTGSDRLGNVNSLIICGVMLTASLGLLFFASDVWLLYLFAVIFSFAYGGEVPLTALLVGEFFGVRAVSALVGLNYLFGRIGVALGAWMAGQIFDSTHSYFIAFIVAAAASLVMVILSIILKYSARPRFPAPEMDTLGVI